MQKLTAVECSKLKATFRNIDALLTQFSLAGSQGYPESDKAEADRMLKKIVEQSQNIRPQVVVPFASFVRFSKADNDHLNGFANTCLDTKAALTDNGITTHLLFPGNAIDLQERPLVDDEKHFLKFYEQQPPDPHPVESPIDIATLRRTISDRITKWQEKYPSVLFRKIGSIAFAIEDLSTTLNVNFKLNTTTIEEKRVADIQINSQPLFFAFAFDFGVQTLGVSGRYRVNHPADVMPRWKFVRIVSSLYNAELYLTWSGLLRPALLRWLWQRRSNVLSNVSQQVTRFTRT